MWRCPHCGAPQAETARCWVCRKSSTTCSTCLHFRRALTGDLGWCALDPRRQPLSGSELRGCWVERPIVAGASKPPPVIPLHRLRSGGAQGSTPRPSAADDAPPPRGFVQIDLVEHAAPADPAGAELPPDTPPVRPLPMQDADQDWSERTSLFGEPSG